MQYLATGTDVMLARKALGVTQEQLGAYWGMTRRNISHWECFGGEYLPHARVMAILLASLRRGWFPAGGKGIKKKRRDPATVVAGQAIRDARLMLDLQMEHLAAYWGMSRANIGHLELRKTLPDAQVWDILLDDLLLQKRTSILRWSTKHRPAVVIIKPRGRYALRLGAGDGAKALLQEQALAANGLQAG